MIEEIKKPLVFEKTFRNSGKDFGAVRAAEKFCKKHGLSVGSMQGKEPRGIKHVGKYLAKWRNLREGDKALLAGILVSKNFRDSDVTLKLAIKLPARCFKPLNESFPIENTFTSVTLTRHIDGYVSVNPPSYGLNNTNEMQNYINAMNAAMARMQELKDQ